VLCLAERSAREGESDMAYVVQQPHSVTNNTDRYRVVEFDDWLRYVNGASSSYACTSFNTYEEAKAAADIANNMLAGS